MAYQVKADAITTRLLDEGENVDGDVVPFPRAFGDVAFRVPVRIADHASGNWQYHNGHMGGGLSGIITGFADNGSGGTTVTLSAAHGWSNGDTVFIDDTGEHYDGSYTITAASGAQFDISATFEAGSGAITGWAWKSGDGSWRVHTDGVPYTGTGAITDNGDDTFQISVEPVGELTVSGTGACTDLDEICQWAATRIGFALFTNTAARSPSPAVDFWANSQMTVPAFLAELAAYNTHLFYIDRQADALVLADMFASNGSRSLYFRKNQVFKREYQPAASNPAAKITAAWTDREFANETAGKYVKDVEREVSVFMDRVCAGTATATIAGKLVDSSASFTALAKIGMTVRNRTNDTSALVIAVDGNTALSLDADIMAAGKATRRGLNIPTGKSCPSPRLTMIRAGSGKPW